MLLIAVFSKKSTFLRTALACSMLLFTACASASKQETIQAEQKAVYSSMNDMVADNSCSTAADCAVVAVGNKACGGPVSYMAYSMLIGDDKITELKKLAERTKALDKQLNQLSGMMSTCVFHSEPALVCEDNRCATSYESNNSIGVKGEIQ